MWGGRRGVVVDGVVMDEFLVMKACAQREGL